MGTPTGPEDASAGASTPPRGISPAATAEGRRLVAGLVVVMLVLASTAILLDRLSPPVEDPDDDGPDIPPEPGSTVMITGTTVWESIEGPYEVYAEVLRGGSLTLRGCDITVAYEDLVYRDAPLFDVMTDASLVLEDTTIRVTLDPNSTRAVYSRPPAYGHMGQDPILSRVVNLLHARTPVLSMNVRWKAPRTDLVVVGQRSPTDDFLLLARLGALGGGGWERLTVDLGPLAGAVARVAVFPLDDGYDALYISDARVLDGGVVPEGDRFDTGIAEEDGWDTGYFRSLVRLGPDGHEPHMGPLINCWSKGTLVMENATLEAPAGLPRWTDHEEGTFLSWLDGQRMMRQMYSHSTIGLHVQLMGGAALEMDASRVLNVPVRALEAGISISGSTLEGDADALTMLRCFGALNDSLVTRLPPSASPGHDPEDKSFTWAVSAEDSDPSRGLAFHDVVVEGGDIGLHLGGTRQVAIDGCSFANASVVCLWSDGASGHGGWPQLNATCAFGPSEGHRYLETVPCQLVSTYARVNPALTYEVKDLLPPVELEYSEGDRTFVRLPVTSVDADGAMTEFPDVTLVADLYGLPVVERAVVPGTPREEFEVEPWTATPDNISRALGEYDIAWPRVRPGAAAGEAVLDIAFDTWTISDFVDPDASIVRVRLDGTTVMMTYGYEGLDMDPYATPDSWVTHYQLPVNLTPGAHEVALEVLGYYGDELGHERIWNRTFRLLRANSTTTPEEAVRFLRGRDMLLLDPDQRLDLGDAYANGPAGGVGFEQFICALWEGSELTVGNSTGPNPWTYLFGRCDGPGTLRLNSMNTTYASLELVNATLVVEGQTGGLQVEMWGSSLVVRGSTLVWGCSITTWSCCTVAVEGSTIASDAERPSLFGMYAYDACSLRVNDTTFWSLVPATVSVAAVMDGNVTFEGCTFTDTNLHITPHRDLWGPGGTIIDVTDCTFSGDCAYVVVQDINNIDIRIVGTTLRVQGCTFDGTGTGVAVQAGVALETNDLALRDGAMVLALRQGRVLYDARNVQVVSAGLAPAFIVIEPFAGDDGYRLDDDYVLGFELLEGDPVGGGTVDVVTLMFDKGPEVLWFEEVVPTGSPYYITIPEWEYIGMAVLKLRQNLLSGIDWWT